MLPLHLAGQPLALLPQRALYLEAERTLLVADAHIGKAVSFRRLGVPVPQGTTTETLDRLSQAIAACAAEHVVFLGDLVHSARAGASATFAAVQCWRERHAQLRLTLVRGNHDRRAGPLPPAWCIEELDGPLRLGPWALVHEPQTVPDAYALAGHVHPGVVLRGRANDALRLPCFRFGARLGLLPAFGAFTGLHVRGHEADERVFVVHADEVRALPG